MIWRNLPCEIIRKIILMSDPSIDTRLYFRLPPKRLVNSLFKLPCHDGIVYSITSKTLHILRIPGCHVIHRPVELDAMDEWFTVFNQDEQLHMIETTTQHGTHVTMSQASFYTEMRVLLKD
jgi:hypothetical protein